MQPFLTLMVLESYWDNLGIAMKLIKCTALDGRKLFIISDKIESFIESTNVKGTYISIVGTISEDGDGHTNYYEVKEPIADVVAMYEGESTASPTNVGWEHDAVDKIIDNLNGRSGLDFDNVVNTTMIEIRETLATIIIDSQKSKQEDV